VIVGLLTSLTRRDTLATLGLALIGAIPGYLRGRKGVEKGVTA
jgi:hypothetical protein